jgi:hypothetical protein
MENDFGQAFVISKMHSPTGKLLGFATVVQDLTEHKRQEDTMLRMEALLRRERDRLSAAAESSMDAFFICEAVRTPEGEIEDLYLPISTLMWRRWFPFREMFF